MICSEKSVGSRELWAPIPPPARFSSWGTREAVLTLTRRFVIFVSSVGPNEDINTIDLIQTS